MAKFIPQFAIQLLNMLRRHSGPSWAMGSQFVTSGGNFLTSALIVRELGLVEFGRFSVCILLVMVVRNLLNGVVLVPMSVVGPKLKARSIASYRGFLLVNCVLFSLAGSLILLLVAIIVGRFLHSDWITTLAVALALANLSSNLADFFRRYEFSRFHAASAFWIDTVRFCVQLLILCGLVTIWRPSFTSETALHAIAAGGLAGTLLGLGMYGAVRWRGALSRALWPRHWRFIRWMFPGVALEAIQANAPLFIGGAILGDAALGGVRAVQQLANILSLPTNALQQVAPAMAARKLHSSDTESVGRLLIKLVIFGLIILMISTAVLLAAWAPIASLLFRSQSMTLLHIFLLYSLVNASSLIKQMMFVYFQAAEAPRAIVETSLIGAVATILGVFALAPSLAELAIPVASLIAASLTIVFLAHRANHSASRRFFAGLTFGRSIS